jgi:excinuclease ABC subunit A
MPQDHIVIRGARAHNLKNIDLALPRDQLVVVTGLSGSGKSSLAFDTLFAEGQRRYIESLSSYARQFLGQMDKPDVDHIEGLSPAISIDQKSTSHNPRSTVGTVTEIYDYMRLLYARIGHPHCPNCGRPVSAQTVEQIVDTILDMPDETRLMLLAPVVRGRKGEYRQTFDALRSQGYVRVRVDGKIRDLSDPIDLNKQKKHDIDVVVDRLVIRHAEIGPIPSADGEGRRDGRDGVGDGRDESRPYKDGAAPSGVELLDIRSNARTLSPFSLGDALDELPMVAETRLDYHVGGNGHGKNPQGFGLPSLGDLLDAEPLEGDAEEIHEDERAVDERAVDERAVETAPRGVPPRSLPSQTTEQPAPVNPMRQRVADSVETTLKLGESVILVAILNDDGSVLEERLYSEKFACVYCNISIEEIAPRTFSFNNPHGACPDCTGLGSKLEVDPELLVMNPDLTLEQGALGPWQTVAGQSQWYSRQLEAIGERHGFRLSTRWRDLSPDQQRVVLFGDPQPVTFRYRNQAGVARQHSTTYEGIAAYVEQRFKEGSEHMRTEMEQYMSARLCPTCQGKRLRPEALAVTVGDRNVYDVSTLAIDQAQEFFSELSAKLSERDQIIARQILKEIRARLGFLVNVGLDYLSISRPANTLSGGEAQRIRLATQIGSGLSGVLYILDEPSIGLHQRDNMRLIHTLKQLRDLGNTLIVIEHDEDTMRSADYIVDIGPGAGAHGGRVVAQGTFAEIVANRASLTGDFLAGRRSIPIPAERRDGNGAEIVIRGAREHNLKDLTVAIPLGMFVAVTGVSGSGKSSLVNGILYPRLAHDLNRAHTRSGDVDRIDGIGALDKVIDIDQSPIGRTPRSNPATYTGAFTTIRELFAQVPEARSRGYGPGRFSFNVKGGRCEACKGDGIIKIEMNFLPDVYVPCEVCRGKRYNREALEIHYKGKSIADVLEMTIEEAADFFAPIPSLASKFSTLRDVGLGYVKLGQPATTLSGGEAQRVKLATELARRATGRTLYILDEPTTGLHFADVERLLGVLQRLADAGNTIVVIEHNLDVIKSADWIIDLGPEGGNKGGQIVAIGTPEQIAVNPASHTGHFLAPLLAEREAAGAR